MVINSEKKVVCKKESLRSKVEQKSNMVDSLKKEKVRVNISQEKLQNNEDVIILSEKYNKPLDIKTLVKQKINKNKYIQVKLYKFTKVSMKSMKRNIKLINKYDIFRDNCDNNSRDKLTQS